MNGIAFETFQTADGLLAYRDDGPRDGEPLVLLHSAFADATQFDGLIRCLTARGFRTVAPDARGHGGSANASRPFRQADDLAALLRHLGLRQVVLVGISMGGMIGVDTAVEYPELVRALVVSGRGLGEPDLTAAWAAAIAERERVALAAGDLPAYLDAFLQWLAGPARSLDQVDPAVVAQVRAMALRTLAKHTPDEPDRRVPVEDVASRAGRIAVPVLAVDGALDLPGLLDTVTALLEAVPDGRRARIEGAGHYAVMERPAEFARILVDFLREIGDPAR